MNAGRSRIVLGRYRLTRRLASGSVGSVYLAVDERFSREVVVKIFADGSEGRESWVAEMRLAMRLDHPNLVRCLDVGTDPEKGPILVFERALGGSMRRLELEGVRFSVEQVRAIGRALAAGLAHAHARGVLHRDVKPENVLAADTERARWVLTDFGAGRFLERGASATSLAGSFEYMAPEVLLSDADARSDLYSLGVLLLELLGGRMSEPSDRAAFVLAHDGAPTLEGVIAGLLHPLPTWRIGWAEVTEVLLSEPQPSIEKAWTGGRSSVLRSGDRVWLGEGDGRAPHRLTVPRAQRLVSTPGAPPIIATHRRAVLCSEDGCETLYASERAIELLTASSEFGRFLVLEGECLVAFDRLGDRLGATPLPAGLDPRALDAAWLSPSVALVTARGQPRCHFVAVEGRRLELGSVVSTPPHARFVHLPEGLHLMGVADDAVTMTSVTAGGASSAQHYERRLDAPLLPLSPVLYLSTAPVAVSLLSGVGPRVQTASHPRVRLLE